MQCAKLRISPAAPHARLIAQFLKIRVFFFNLVYKKIGVPLESLLRPHREAQPKAVAAVVGGAVVTERYPADPREAIVAAATVHAARPTRRTVRVRLTAAAVAAIPVTAPLPHVATHVVQPKGISRLASYRVCL